MERYEYLRALERALADLRRVVTESHEEKVDVAKTNRLFGSLVNKEVSKVQHAETDA